MLALEENDILFGTRLEVPSWIGLFIYLLATIIVIIARGNLVKQGLSTLLVRENHELITTGLYKYLHHPIYSRILLVVIGFAFMSQSIFISLITSEFFL